MHNASEDALIVELRYDILREWQNVRQYPHDKTIKYQISFQKAANATASCLWIPITYIYDFTEQLRTVI